ncbi:MAG TPA: protein rep [Alphaproteobacteria bacterium]|nr:protein rep [Alphaproteobacteria bacterium]
MLRRGEDARFGGVQTCGSVWACPCCSARISEVRRQELRKLQAWVADRPHLRLVMMTLTARHRQRGLSSLLERMGKAKARMQNRKPWKPLRLSGRLVGSVSVREATHGAHGWHPHYHVLCILKADSDGDACEMLEPLRRVWVECLEAEGLGGTMARAFHLATGEAVAEYVSKAGTEVDQPGQWGIAEEMTLGRLKRGRGEKGASPWQVLREAHAGDEDARALWREYATTMHGRQQQVWSNGLKAAVGIGEVEDEDAAAGEEYSEDQDETLHSFDRAEWRHWRRWRAAILAAGRRGGDAVAALLRDGPQRTETECEVIEDDPPAPVSMPRPTIPAGGLAAQAMAAIGQGAQRRAGPRQGGVGGRAPQPPAGTNR